MQIRLATIRTILIAVALIAAVARSLAQEASPATAQDLLEGAVERLRDSASFRLEIEQSGAPYPLSLTLDGVNLLPASLISAEAQFVNPAALHISALVRLFIPLSLEFYSQGESIWISFPAGAPWLPLPAFEGFDINQLLAADAGVELLAASLRDIELAEAEILPRENPSWRVSGVAPGAAVADLLFGFIEPQDEVAIDAFIDAEDGKFAGIDMRMLETAEDPLAEPALWHIRFVDYDAEPSFQPPET